MAWPQYSIKWGPVRDAAVPRVHEQPASTRVEPIERAEKVREALCS